MESVEREGLLSDLRHRDEEIRRLGVERLSLLAPAEAVALLVDSLGDTSWRVRKAAVERLVALEDTTAAAQALVAALADGENSGRRNAALEALTRFGADAAPVLVATSRAADVDVRKQAVDALAAIADPATAGRLIELLADEDANVRASAAEALGGIPSVSGALLEAATGDAEPLVRLAALRSLARLECSLSLAELAPALGDALLRPAACLLLGWSDDPGAEEALVKALGAGARSTREAAMDALVRRIALATPGTEGAPLERLRAATVDAPFLPDALARLRTAPPATRLVLARFLGLLARPDCLSPLLEAAEETALREVVLGALTSGGPLLEREVVHTWPRLGSGARLAAVELLGRTRGEAGEAFLVQLLAPRESMLCAAAARSLAERGARAALPALVRALRSAAEGGPEGAAGELVQALEVALLALLTDGETAFGSRAAALLEAESDAAPEPFRLATARLLGRIGAAAHQARLELLLSDPSAEVRRAAVESLARVAPYHLEPLRFALADEAPAVRIGAATALAATGDPSVVADLASLMDDREPRVAAAALRGLASWCRATEEDSSRNQALLLLSVGLAHGGAAGLAALDALSSIGGADAVMLARSALGSPEPELAEAAVACVGMHAPREELNELLTGLRHGAWNVRARVAQVMQERRHVRSIPALIRQLEEEQDDFVQSAILAALGSLESD